MRFLNEDEASKTMSLFEEASERKKISKSALKNWVVRIWQRMAFSMRVDIAKSLFLAIYCLLEENFKLC